MTLPDNMNGPDWGCVRDAWEEMRNRRMMPMRIGYDPEFRAKLAEDHREIAGYNNYEYGRMAVEVLGGILDSDSRVLEIGACPGTLTIPLSGKVKRIVVVESSGAAVASLSKNLAECRVENVEVMNRNWLEMGEREIGGRFRSRCLLPFPLADERPQEASREDGRSTERALCGDTTCWTGCHGKGDVDRDNRETLHWRVRP